MRLVLYIACHVYRAYGSTATLPTAPLGPTAAQAEVAAKVALLRGYPAATDAVLNLLLPLDQPYRPLAVDLGVLALYGLVVVWLSSWVKRRIKYASWRALHYTRSHLINGW